MGAVATHCCRFASSLVFVSSLTLLSHVSALPQRRLLSLLARCRGYALLLAVSLFACLVSFAASPWPTNDRVCPSVILTCPLTGSGLAGDAQRPPFCHSRVRIAAAARAGTPLPPLFYRMEIADDAVVSSWAVS